jgi:aspartate aminotransferase-like enzyme
MISVSEDAWRAHKEARMPRFYWDFAKAKSYLEKGQTPWTPGMTMVFALSTSLNMMLAEGLTNIFARHARVAKAARDSVKSLGLPLFADEKYASNTVTAIAGANGLNIKEMLRILREEHQVVLGGGQRRLDGKIFRIGHMGWVAENDINMVISALKSVLPQAGFRS